MAILDDDFGRKDSDELLLKVWRERKIYSFITMVLAPAWGFFINYGASIVRSLGGDLALTFYTGMAVLLLGYIGLIFRPVEFVLRWSIATVVWSVVLYFIINVIVVIVVDTLNLGQRTLPALCFFSALIAVSSSLFLLKRVEAA